LHFLYFSILTEELYLAFYVPISLGGSHLFPCARGNNESHQDTPKVFQRFSKLRWKVSFACQHLRRILVPDEQSNGIMLRTNRAKGILYLQRRAAATKPHQLGTSGHVCVQIHSGRKKAFLSLNR